MARPEWYKEKVLSLDRKHIWHPFTQMKDYETRDPVIITKAQGAFLYTIEGVRLYDTISSWWTNVHGHLHPRLVEAINKQLELLDHVNFAGFTHPYATEVVERLKKFLPPALSRFFFSDNGSTAVEVALKMAFQYWQNRGFAQKTRFVCIKEAYHGDTIGAVSVGGVDLYHQLYKPLTFKTFRTPAPYCYRCPDNPPQEFTKEAPLPPCSLACLEKLKNIFAQHAQEICAIIVEPRLLAAGGMIVYPVEYLKGLVELAHQYEILVIFDEVATGFARTGTMFALEQAQVVPDIICLAKGLTGGMLPMALTVATEEIYQAFYADYMEGKTFFHGHSFTANPIACAVSAASLALFEEENPVKKGAPLRKYFHKRLIELFADEPYVGDIRYLGYVGALELVANRRKKTPFPPEKRIGFQIYMTSLNHGLVLRPLGDVIYWFLPYCLSTEDIDSILMESRNTIREVVLKEL